MHFTLSSPEDDLASLLMSYPVSFLPTIEHTVKPILPPASSTLITSFPPSDTSDYYPVIRPTSVQSKPTSVQVKPTSIKAPVRPRRPPKILKQPATKRVSELQDETQAETVTLSRPDLVTMVGEKVTTATAEKTTTKPGLEETTSKPDSRLSFQEKLQMRFKKFRQSSVGKILTRRPSITERRSGPVVRTPKELGRKKSDKAPKQDRRIALLRKKLQAVIESSSDKLRIEKSTLVRTFVPAHLRTKPAHVEATSLGEIT
jgi:hypothetical protein